MSETFLISRRASSAGFQVTAPRRGDVLSDSLHRAYDDRRVLPDDWLGLIGQLDRIASIGC